jgi:hypothetical protein
MLKPVEFSRMLIHAKIVPCAHSCKYCLMGDKKLMSIERERVLELIERFLEWEATSGQAVKIAYVLNYTSDYDRHTLRLIRDLDARYPRSYPPLSGITLGGLPWRSEEDLRLWLLERQEFGCKTAHGSLAGVGVTHDYWNSRPGNFDLIMSTLRIAGEIGMALGARMFVARSTLPQLEKLNAMLDDLPKHEGDWRYAQPFFYSGWGARLESERIDERIRDNLPRWLDPLIKGSADEGSWLSEREWIRRIENGASAPQKHSLVLNLNNDNFEELSRISCDQIVSDLMQRTRSAYAAIPTLEELCAKYGNRDETAIYILERCVETKWLDRYLQENPTVFERHLTHLQMGN